MVMVVVMMMMVMMMVMSSVFASGGACLHRPTLSFSHLAFVQAGAHPPPDTPVSS